MVTRKVPHTGGGAVGAARLARIVATVEARLEPGQRIRPGRPTDASWVLHPTVPMSDDTKRRLARLAEQSRADGRKVSPMPIERRAGPDLTTEGTDSRGKREQDRAGCSSSKRHAFGLKHQSASIRGRAAG